jgi:hypothetical protein
MSSRPLSASPLDRTSEADEEAKFRARMARLAPETAGRRPRRSGARLKGRGIRLGWKGWLAVDALIVLSVLAGVVAWPPVQACRHQDRTIGFYAGDSVERCIRRGIAARLDTADQRLTSLARGSGH